MFTAISKQSRRLLLVTAALALVAAACSSGTSSAAPAGTNGSATTNAPAGTGAAANNGGAGGDLTGAAGKFSSIKSYKFSMTLAGGTFGSMTALLGGGANASAGAAFTVSGTVVSQPAKASDITMAGFHIIEVGGFDYMDLGLGGFTKTAVSGSTSMADSFSPSTMFSSSMTGSAADGYSKVGSETKNGVDTDHFQASSAALAQYGSVLGVAGATWSSDVWIAKDGGYPVSMAIIAKAADNTVAYEILFDITNINDPANAVTAPTNIMGA
jgi:hypothetical protein